MIVTNSRSDDEKKGQANKGRKASRQAVSFPRSDLVEKGAPEVAVGSLDWLLSACANAQKWGE